MKRIAAIIITICMAATCVCTGIPQMAVTGDGPEAYAASYPKLKTIKYAATGNQRKDIIGFAKSQLGYKEGSNNNTYFGSWYGCNYAPWCAMFVVWSARKAGVAKSVIPSLATADRSWAKNKGIYHKSKHWGGSYTPKKGDLIYFSWSVRDYADHIGMVTGTGTENGTKCVYTIEGNKRDKVVEETYALSNKYILGYTSPKYEKKGASDQTEETTKLTAGAGEYILKYRDGLDETNNDEEDAIIPPVKGKFGTDLILSKTKFKRTGYTYTKVSIYRSSSGNTLYLCRDTATQTKEGWYQKSKIPEGYKRVYVKTGSALNISKSVSGTIYTAPVWKKKTYKITYDPNGGANAPAEQTKTHGTDLTLATEKPSGSALEFKGWSTDPTALSAQYQPGAVYKTDAALALYAVWGAPTYKVKTTAKVTVRSGAGKSYKGVASVASGKTLSISEEKNGWGRTSDGRWVELKYTQKVNVKEYRLEYTDDVDATKDDTHIIMPALVNYGSAVKTSTVKFVKAGHEYSEWQLYYLLNGKKVYLNHDKSGKEGWYASGKAPKGWTPVRVKAGDKLSVKTCVGDQIYITPVWNVIKYKVKYSANGGKKAPKQQTKTYGKALKLRKGKPTRKGYVFMGWATASNAAKAQYQPADKYKANSSVKLYAVWKKASAVNKVKTTDEVNKRKGPGIGYDVIGVLPKGKTVIIVKKKNGWGKLNGGGWISLSLTKKVSSKGSAKGSSNEDAVRQPDTSGDNFVVKVTTLAGLNARQEPEENSSAAEFHSWGEELTVTKVEDGWGLISESGSWIPLADTKISDGYTVKVTGDPLTQRAGPGKDFDTRGDLEPGTYDIAKIDGSWGKVRSTGYWIKLENTKRVN